LFGDFHQPNFDFAQFDGILSGGLAKHPNQQTYPQVLKALKKLHEKNPLLNLGGEKAEVFSSLTEQTFLAIFTLNDLTQTLQFAQNILNQA
jgi:hypothetical protein